MKISRFITFIKTLLCLLILTIFPSNLLAKSSNIEEVLSSFEALKNKYIENKDHRLVFTYVYLESTKAIKKQIDTGVYENPSWVEDATVNFANLYISAIQSYDLGETPPGPWHLSFEVNKAKDQYLSLQLLLAINAHINHDLPFALEQTFKNGFSPNQVKSDFLKMNELFNELTPVFFELIYEMEDLLDVSYQDKGLKEYFIFNYIKWMRNNAWNSGVQLFSARGMKRKKMVSKIEEDSLDHGYLIYNGRFIVPRH
tara:strand:- start:53 stop:820 length:768 start_codon:yes stop_codon:yes gene_type:complete